MREYSIRIKVYVQVVVKVVRCRYHRDNCTLRASNCRFVVFQDRGTPARSTNTTVKITIVDNDDLDPKFTRDVYRAKIHEFYPMPVSVR